MCVGGGGGGGESATKYPEPVKNFPLARPRRFRGNVERRELTNRLLNKTTG